MVGQHELGARQARLAGDGQLVENVPRSGSRDGGHGDD